MSRNERNLGFSLVALGGAALIGVFFNLVFTPKLYLVLGIIFLVSGLIFLIKNR